MNSDPKYVKILDQLNSDEILRKCRASILNEVEKDKLKELDVDCIHQALLFGLERFPHYKQLLQFDEFFKVISVIDKNHKRSLNFLELGISNGLISIYLNAHGNSSGFLSVVPAAYEELCRFNVQINHQSTIIASDSGAFSDWSDSRFEASITLDTTVNAYDEILKSPDLERVYLNYLYPFILDKPHVIRESLSYLFTLGFEIDFEESEFSTFILDRI